MFQGLVSNVQRYSLHDGPGIRTTVFLKGCPLRCAWCHNPENLTPRPEVMVIETRCVRCGACLEVCPDGRPVGAEDLLRERFAESPGPVDRRAAAVEPGRAATGHEAVCRLCGACVEACPTGARQMIGRPMSVAELLEMVLSDQIFYDDSGGGVTFSGGEPLTQFEFLRAALSACKGQGLHTAVDTCGYAERGQLLAIAPSTDLFLFDLKFMDDARHREFCGVSNQPILDNLAVLGKQHSCIWIRLPVIPGMNDSEDNLAATARFVATIPGVRQVNLLPYHRVGVPKFKRVRQPCDLPELQPPSPEQMEAAAEPFRRLGLVVKLGG